MEISEEMKRSIKILVVEDNLLNQKLAGFILADWGFHYKICSNGKLAVEELSQNSYDLILMDIQMPEMDGYEATHFIREKLHLGMPIIAMTAQVLDSERDKCLSHGMTNYISKPIVEQDLFNMIIGSLPS